MTDGFRLAEEDLRLRGPGEVLGTSQHGFPELKAANPVEDADLMEAARDIGAELLDHDERGTGGERLRMWMESGVGTADQFLASG